jgi:hypothetical protein
LNEGQRKHCCDVREALGTGYNRVEGNRRASRNGRASDLPPEIPPLRFATFSSLYGVLAGCGVTAMGGCATGGRMDTLARRKASTCGGTTCASCANTPPRPCATCRGYDPHCIIHPSCTMHHASCASYIPHAPCIMYHAHRTSLMHHASCIMRIVHPSCTMHHVSCASYIPHHHASCIGHRTPLICAVLRPHR